MVKFKKVAAILLILSLTAMMPFMVGCTAEEAPSNESAAVKLERPDSVESSDEALSLLKDGNERFIASNLALKDLGENKRRKLVGGQKPFAIILSCSDSRVPPELVFDQGLGDLFVIRVAGNVDDTVTLGSIEYAAEHLHTPLLVVMGHSSCGAVKATVEGGEVPPNIAEIAKKIIPAVEIAKTRNTEEAAIVEDAVIENVKAVIEDIEANSDIIRELAEYGKIKVIGAKYHLDSGRVEFLQ